MNNEVIQMDNREVAALFKELSGLMELAGENPFKIRSYDKAYRTIKGLKTPVLNMDEKTLSSIPGFGKAIVHKLEEIKEKATFNTLERYRREIPKGLVEISHVQGLGPAKVKLIHRQLGIDSLEDLLAAAEDASLARIKGISQRTLQQIIPSIRFLIDARGKLLYNKAEKQAQLFEDYLRGFFPDKRLHRVGDLLVFENVIQHVDLLVEADRTELLKILKTHNISYEEEAHYLRIPSEETIEQRLYCSASKQFGRRVLELSCSGSFYRTLLEDKGELTHEDSVGEVFNSLNMAYIPPQLWHEPHYITLAKQKKLPDFIQTDEVRGLIHFHSFYSDGSNGLEDMIVAALDKGMQYAVVTDHSQSAGYANGMKKDMVFKQWAEIKALRDKYPDIDVYKGIEADILKDGALDFDDELLAQFDLVIASVHSGLNMEKEQATQRLIKAIAHPHVDILGHLTGRLLLRRQGYPIDHEAVIDACAAHDVAIEINANPRRLDLDWHWVSYAMERGVMLSIQPDAHSIKEIDNIKYGALAGRKGGLTVSSNLSSLSREAFARWIKRRR